MYLLYINITTCAIQSLNKNSVQQTKHSNHEKIEKEKRKKIIHNNTDAAHHMRKWLWFSTDFFCNYIIQKQIIRQKPLCDHLECFMFHSFHWACPSTSYIHYIWWWWWWNFFFFFDAFVHLNILSGHSTQISFYLINGKWESNNNNNNKKKYGFIQANYYYYYLYLYYYV